MYYLFQDTNSDHLNYFIQLTFNDQLVATCTEWTKYIPNFPIFIQVDCLSGNWSTLDEWLSHDTFALLTTSPTPITPLTHPEFLI